MCFMQQNIIIGIIGGAETVTTTDQLAYELGSFIAERGAQLVCGGLGGAMLAASRGAHDHGGTVIGILPGLKKTDANPFVTIAIPTGMGVARNVLVVHTADVLIALPGSYGTLSEIALALDTKKTVVYLPGGWDLKKISPVDSALFKEAFDARQAIGLALGSLAS